MIQKGKLLGVMIMLSLTLAGFGQSRKTIRDKGVASQTVQEYFIEEGMDKPVVESIEKYNKEGDLIEIQVFNRVGEIKQWEKYSYDEEGNLVEEIFMDQKGNIERTEKSIYKDGLRVEQQYFNNRGKLFKKKIYQYEYYQ